MLLDPVTWMPASRSEEVLDALDARDRRAHRGRDARLRRRARDRRRTRRSPSAIDQLAELRSGLADAARRARAGRRRGGHAPAGDAGRTPRSPPARATSSSTRRCASSPGASRRSRCTCTSPCPTSAAAIRALNGMREHLPLLLALSANSPFWQGRDSGLASARTPVFQAFPRTGTPRRVRRPTTTTSRRSTCCCAATRSPSRRSCGGTCACSRGSARSRCGSWTRRRACATPPRSPRSCSAWSGARRSSATTTASRSRPRCSRRTASSPRATACDAEFVVPAAGRCVPVADKLAAALQLVRAARRVAALPARAGRRRRARRAHRRAAPARGRRARRGPARRPALDARGLRELARPSPRVPRLEVRRAGRRAVGLGGAGGRVGLPAGGVAEAGALEHLQRQQRALHARGGDVDPEQVEHERRGRA